MRSCWASVSVVLSLFLPLITAVFVCGADEIRPVPPVAKEVPKELTAHGQTRIDPYYWMKERDDPAVVDYLKAENAYLKEVTAPFQSLVDTLYTETKARIKQTDMSAPFVLRGYRYYRRTEDGKQYPIYCRRAVRKTSDDSAPEEVLVDVNQLAEGHAYCSVAGRDVSPNNRLLAFAVDTVGRRFYTLRIKDLDTGQILPDEIANVTGNLTWAEDGRTLFYSKQDPVTLRSYQIYRHRLGTDPADDVLVYEERDPEFSCYVFKSRSRSFVVIACSQTLSNEYRYVDAQSPEDEFTVFLPREANHEHRIDHLGDHIYIRTNLNAKNFRLMRTPIAKTAKTNWKEVVPHRDDVLLSSFTLFRDFLVLSERRNGLMHLRIAPWEGDGEHELEFGEPAYMASVGRNPEQDTTVLRYRYNSMTTPSSVFDYDMQTREKTLIKRQEVLGGFHSEDYVTERREASARDGTQVPVSIVYHKETLRDGTAPCLLYGYGSYGASMDATFNSSRLNLLDRGFVYAIAHIRGGQELGRAWYDDGKLLRKKNTFRDFIDVGEFLIREKYAAPDKLFARGGSAGGLLIGAVVNMRPDLFCGVIADVPFVDVITTMLDDSIPLTTSEFDEWGNPHDKTSYDYMLSYSPYDHVAAKDYPHMLVTTGIQDSQVQYWEPAKWVAKLRAEKTGQNLLLLKTNLGAGHGGASGRYDRYRETALRHAFLIYLAGQGR